MNWTEIKISVPTADLETACAVAQMTVPYGLYIEDYSDLEAGAREVAHTDLIDEELLNRDRLRGIIHIYISAEESQNEPFPGAFIYEALDYLKDRYAAAGIVYEIVTESVSDGDWADSWKRFFKPLPVGERLMICPSWETADPGGRARLRLDPDAAFGTGTHATTQLCLNLLEAYITPDCAFLDVGCGSGILSIAAALLGAGSVTGVDIDPVAVKTARENAEINGISRFRFDEGDLTRTVSGTFDVIAANIVADVIVALCPDIPGFLKPGGVFICSGVIDSRADEVAAALAGAGLAVPERREKEGWVAFTAEAVFKDACV